VIIGSLNRFWFLDLLVRISNGRNSCCIGRLSASFDGIAWLYLNAYYERKALSSDTTLAEHE
jgi:hypothetical protein